MKTKREKGYGLKLIGLCGGQISAGMETVVISQLTYYLTESVLMAAATVGILLMCTKFFDGFTDAVAGFLVDRTHSRWGKARPYSLLYVPMWIAMVLIYSVPQINVKLQIAYVFVMYVIIEAIGRTFIICIQSVLLHRAVYEEDQVKYMAVGAVFAFVFGLVASVAMPVLIKIYGSTRTGWTIIALIFAVPGSILGFLQFLFVKEFPVPEKEQKAETIPFMTGLRALFQNKYAWIFGCVIFLYNLASGTAGTYYARYVIGDVGAMGVISGMAFLSMLLMIVLPRLQKQHGSARLIRIGLWVACLGCLGRYLFPTNILYQGLMAIVYMGGTLPAATFMNLVSIDCMKYSHYQTGLRLEGVVSSVNGVATKLGAGLGAAALGLLMGLSGYDGSAAVQSDSAITMIRFLYAGLPAITTALCAIVMHFYDLDSKLPEINAELERRGAAEEKL